MSHSESDRLQNRNQTLLRMFEAVGDDHGFDEVSVAATDDGFTETFPTTWVELAADGLIDDKFSVFGQDRFTFTPYGWLSSFQLSGGPHDAETIKRGQTLVQALKESIDGRQEGHGRVDPDVLSAKTRLPSGWVFNVVKTNALALVFPGRRWDAEIDETGYVFVKTTFGLTRLSS